jgi:hypothetical protein
MATESGRPCGCDPAADHVCAGHAAHRDSTETDIYGAWAFDEHHNHVPCTLVVTGPDDDEEICILAADSVYLTRFQAEELANEILRRLAPRTTAT